MKLNVSQLQRRSGEELDMHPGDTLLIEPHESGVRFKTPLVGLLRPEYLAVKLPVKRSLIDLLTPKRVSTIRFMNSEGQIYGFESAVINVAVRPFPLLFLSYPEKLDVLNLRRYERADCFSPGALYVGEESAEKLPGMLVNISKGGCSFSCAGEYAAKAARVAENLPVTMRSSLPAPAVDLVLRGQIKRVETLKERTLLGLAFETPSEETQTAIERYIRLYKEHVKE